MERLESRFPIKEQLSQWLETEEAKKAHEIFAGLYRIRHGGSPYGSLHLNPEFLKLSARKQMKWLWTQLPIVNIRHAVYSGPKNKLVLSSQTEAWDHLEGTFYFSARWEKEIGFLDQKGISVGTVAKIKSTGWKIFVPEWAEVLWDRSTLSKNVTGIEKKGYVVLIPTIDKKTGHYMEGACFSMPSFKS